MDDTSNRPLPLWSLKDQWKLAKNILNNNADAQSLPIKKQLEALKAFLYLLVDAEKVTHIENVLVEHGLMNEVERRSTIEFVPMGKYKKLEEQKKMYYQNLQKLSAEKDALQEKLLEALGGKRVPGDEKW